jgi:hypothetical protein
MAASDDERSLFDDRTRGPLQEPPVVDHLGHEDEYAE